MKGRVSPEFLRKLKDKVNIIEVVGEHVVLKKSGANHSGLCPFHSERTPSFSVSENKQLYHCYGCKKGGDLVSFVMEIHGLSFPEALEELAHRANLALPKEWSYADANEDPELAKRRAVEREKMALAHKLNRFVAAFYHLSLSRQPHIERYFGKRGVRGDLARSFYVGAAPASWHALSEHLVAKQAPLPLAVELGLIKASKKNAPGPGYFDLFRNRAMFPIIDMRGKVVAFGGRGLPLPQGAPDVGGESPKYLNSPESFIFHKSKVAFGLYQAQKHIREANEVILVEGYFDVLALHAAGFENVVATCGTSLTPDHLRLFRRVCEKVTILFDGDKAGVSATERAMETGLEQGAVLYGAAMPEDLDPDEVLFDQDSGELRADGIARMKEILAASRPLLDSRMEEMSRQARNGPEAQTQALKQVAAWLARFQDPVGREVRAESAARSLGVPRELLNRAIQSAGGSAPAPAPRNPRARAVSGAKQRISRGERIVLTGLARGTEFATIFQEARRNLPPKMTFSDLFEYLPARQVVAEIERFQAAPESVLTGEVDSQLRSILTEALVGGGGSFQENELRIAVGHCLGRAWARFSQQIKRALAEAEAKKDAGLQAELMKEYLDVQRKMKEFSSFYDEA